MKEILKKLNQKRELAIVGGGRKRQDSQHKKGKLTARERIRNFLDEGTLRNGICLLSIDALSLKWISRKFQVTELSLVTAL